MRLTRTRRSSGALLCAVLTAVGVMGAQPAAFAAGSDCSSGASSGPESAQTFITCVIVHNGNSGAPPSYGTWTPPVCWIEPQYTGIALKTYIEGQMATGLAGVGSEGGQWLSAVDGHYLALNPPYEIGQAGMWWGVACRTNDLTYETAYQAEMAAAGLTAYVPWKWVPTGGAVGAPNPATPQLLAEYAAAQITPPAVGFSVPSTTETVNLSTRVYSSAPLGTYQTITATASLAGIGSSTVTAVPDSVTVTPNGPAKTLGGVPVTSFTCAITNGGFGSPNSDACAFDYTKATAGTGTYPLSVSMTWTVDWVGHTGAGFPVTITTTANPQPVRVQEVQAVVGN